MQDAASPPPPARLACPLVLAVPALATLCAAAVVTSRLIASQRGLETRGGAFPAAVLFTAAALFLVPPCSAALRSRRDRVWSRVPPVHLLRVLAFLLRHQELGDQAKNAYRKLRASIAFHRRHGSSYAATELLAASIATGLLVSIAVQHWKTLTLAGSLPLVLSRFLH